MKNTTTKVHAVGTVPISNRKRTETEVKLTPQAHIHYHSLFRDFYKTSVAHLSVCFEETLYRTCHMCFLPNYCSFGYSVSEKICFRNQLIRNKNCLWWPCLWRHRDEMSNLYRGPSIVDASYQVSPHFDMQLQRRIFLFLEIVQSETSIACGGHVCERIGTKWTIVIEDLTSMLPTKFQFIWLRGFRGED